MLPDSDDLIGTMLGKDYRVLQQIGAGGMAVVYLVEHQTLLKQFAAKVLSPALASSLEARARFTQEAHAASQLDHENIVSISDFGVTVDHRPFFVMELLRGQTLDQRLADGPMSLEEVIAVCVPVARALAHAHAEGIVHLDVKPENIFLVQRSQGRWGVKVVDFGIAKTPLDPRIANTGETVGSPMFMAPEVCRGADDIDQRADVYSFGILLYLMMCGRLPFVDDSLVRVLQMQLVELPPPPREVNSQLSPELAVIVERALAKHPDDRYPSMEALLRDLDAALPLGADRLLIEAQSGTPVRDTPFPRALSVARHESQRASRPSHPIPPSAVMSRQPPAPRNRGRALLMSSLMVAIAAIGALVWWQLDNRGAAARGRDPQAPPTRTASTEAVTPSQPPPSAVPAAPAPARPASAAAAESADVENPIADTITAADPRTEAAATVDPPTMEQAAAVRPGETLDATSEAKPELKIDPASAKKLPARIRSTVRSEPPRPTKRSSAIALAGSAGPRAGQGAGGAAAAPLAPTSDSTEAGARAVSAAASGAERDPQVIAREPAEGAAPAASPITVAAPAAPAAPTPAPVAAPTPLPVAPPPVAITPIKPPPNPGTLDAVPSVTALEVKGSLSTSIVRRSVERALPSLRTCYRSAARAAGATPAIDLQLSFEIDENGLATQVTTGSLRFGAMASCAAEVARKIRTQGAPDVGTAQVTVGIRFHPS